MSIKPAPDDTTIPVTYYVTFNSDTVWAERYIAIQSTTYLKAWDRCEREFMRCFSLHGPAGWRNYQGLTIAQRRKLTEITWTEAVAGWVHPERRPSPYKNEAS